MPLTNRAPVNAAGQIMVTGTTPTPAWPVLGGMTYEPVTGELAVTSAVPNATDPWVGGLRFTNLGSLYIVTTIPSPVFYVGGLPVSTLGQLFMSANPPVGSVGGWPIAGDGGVAGIGSGIGPVPIFWAPLLTTLVPTTAGNPAFTFTRATTAYVADHENILRQAVAGEARFQGARRVRNIVTKSENFTVDGVNWASDFGTATVTPNDAVAPDGTLTADKVVFGANAGSGSWMFAGTSLSASLDNLAYRGSIYVKGTVGETFNIWTRIAATGANESVAHVTLTGGWDRITPPGTTIYNVASGPTLVIGTRNLNAALGTAGTVWLWGAQLEAVSGQSNQAPSDYVSVGVLAAPYHGNAIDGVKYLPTVNANSVAGNIVTEATGSLIPAATLLGYVAENAATNLCFQSQTFDVTWSVLNCGITPNTQTAPDGTLTADVFADTVGSGQHRVLGNVITYTAAAYTFSCYVKQGTLPWVQLFMNPASGGSGFAWANFNLATGAAGFKDPNVTATSAVALPNGWWRVSITATMAAGGNGVQIFSAPSDINSAGPSYAGTGQTMYLWGAQVETGSDPSSYVPTTTVAVLRNRDILDYQMVSNVDGAIGTAYSEVYLPTPWTGQQLDVLIKVVGTFYFQYYDTAKKLGSFANSAALVTSNALTVAAVNKNAAAWSGVTRSVCLNGGVVATGAFVAQVTEDKVTIAAAFNTSNALRGSIRNVKFYATRLTDVELQGLTA